MCVPLCLVLLLSVVHLQWMHIWMGILIPFITYLLVYNNWPMLSPDDAHFSCFHLR
jgi:hypothetical protein